MRWSNQGSTHAQELELHVHTIAKRSADRYHSITARRAFLIRRSSRSIACAYRIDRQVGKLQELSGEELMAFGRHRLGHLYFGGINWQERQTLRVTKARGRVYTALVLASM